MSAAWSENEGSGAPLARRAALLDVTVPSGARERVWKGIERRRARAPWRLAFPMFLAGAASAALILLLAQSHRRPEAEPDRALVLLADGTQHAVRSGERLPSSPELALVDLRAAGRMVAGAGAQARLDRFEHGAVELSLERGTLLLHVNPRKADEAFVVRTPGFVARVVGTVLRVAVGEGGRASIVVAHGAVAVTPIHGAPLLVHAGERWPAGSEEAPSAAELDQLGTAELEGVTAASFGPVLRETPNLPGESALYTAALQKLKSGDARVALALWREQRQRFPRGVLERDAHASIIDALVALHADASALGEIDAYLRQTPDGLRSSEMHFVRATIERAADHDCRRAAADLDRALSRPADPWASRARAARAACKKL